VDRSVRQEPAGQGTKPGGHRDRRQGTGRKLQRPAPGRRRALGVDEGEAPSCELLRSAPELVGFHLGGVGRELCRRHARAEPDGQLEELGKERVERRHRLTDGERLRQEVGEGAHVLAPLPTQVRLDLDPALQQGFEVSWGESPQMGGE
jgi:hypothetical protein